jgi:ABC-type transporter Mla subunit MlaD
MRRLALIALLLLGVPTALVVASASAGDSHSYRVELDNAFGLVNGSEVRIAGVTSGTVTGLDVNAAKKAVVTVSVSGPLSQFHQDAICSSQPQSLIAEYFLDCQPGQSDKLLPDANGDPTTSCSYDKGCVPVAQTHTTVQNDLVQNTLREPFKERFALILNEFGTALAGNPNNLNAAIRRGAPTLSALRKALAILARQNTIIANLNLDSDKIISRLAARRQDVVRFVQTANRTAQASANQRTALARNFQLLPGFLEQLRPTLKQLGNVAEQQTPLLTDLNASAGQLTRLSVVLPKFNDASVPAITTLGAAAKTGRQALAAGTDEIQALKQASKNAYPTANQLANLLVDLDDPKRAVETNPQASVDTGRAAPTGYTGLEGLLNYGFFQTTAVNQYDQIGHLLHFDLTGVGTGPCGNFNGGPSIPAAAGGQTTNAAQRDPCVAWLGPKQPGISEQLPVKPYDPSVCPQGSSDTSLCNPAGRKTSSARLAQQGPGSLAGAAPQSSTRGAPPSAGSTAPPSANSTSPAPGAPQLGGIGGLLGIGGGNGDKSGIRVPDVVGGNAPVPRSATNDLLNFLFAN